MSRGLRSILILAISAAASLTGAGSAAALVVDMNALGKSTVPYSASDVTGYDGVALVPGTCSGPDGGRDLRIARGEGGSHGRVSRTVHGPGAHTGPRPAEYGYLLARR